MCVICDPELKSDIDATLCTKNSRRISASVLNPRTVNVGMWYKHFCFMTGQQQKPFKHYCKSSL